MSMLPPILVELKANASEFMSKMGAARGEVSKLGTESSAHMQKFAAVGKAALFGVAGAAVAVGGASLEMADKWETAHAKLKTAIEDTDATFGDWTGDIKTTDAHLARLGYTSAEVEDSLAVLTTSSGNVKQALSLQSTAADLARFKGIGLSDASFMLSRALQGNSRVLKQLGIDLPVNAKSAEALKVAQENLSVQSRQYQVELAAVHAKHKVSAADIERLKLAHDKLAFAQKQVTQATHAHTLILDALNRKIHGQADAYTETFAGKVAALRAQTENLGVTIGTHLIPVLLAVANKTAEVVQWFERHRTVAEVLGIAVGTVLVAAITAYTVSMVAAAAATIAASAPILAIIAVVAAVGVAIFELATHWSTVWGGIKTVAADVAGFFVRNVWDAALKPTFDAIRSTVDVVGSVFGAVWRGVEAVVSATWRVVGPIFRLWLDVGLFPLKLAVALLATAFVGAWDGIKRVVETTWTALRPVFEALVHAGIWLVKGEVESLKDVWSAAWFVIKAVTSAVGSALHAVFSGISSALQVADRVWSTVWADIRGTVEDAWTFLSPIFDAIKNAIDTITSGVHKVTGIVHDLPGSSVLHKLHVPGFAVGTDYAPGGMALVGEQGPELVNLPRGSQVFPHGTAPAGGGGNLTVNFLGPVFGADSEELARKVRDSMLRMQGRTGSLGFAA